MSNSNSKSFCFMAVAGGRSSDDVTVIKKYAGIGSVKVLAINPTKAQIKDIMGFEPKEEPVYVGTTKNADNKDIATARITFIVQTIAEDNHGIDTKQMLTYFINNEYNRGSDSGKYQVIDEYGRTAWADEETVRTKGQIMYKNGPANITRNYRPAYVGEEALTNFISTFLRIPNPANYVNGTWVMKTDKSELEKSLCRLDEIPSYFKGNIKEIKDSVALQPDNRVKLVFGIRVDENGNERQDIYNRSVIAITSDKYDKIQKEIEDSQRNGGLSGRTYEFTPLHEYTVAPTNFTSPAPAADPFGGTPAPKNPFA